jgi:hypothetical protein
MYKSRVCDNMAVRLDLEGLRVRMPGDSNVYLIDKGTKRGLYKSTYDQLWNNDNFIHPDLHIDEIDNGSDFDSENTYLFRAKDGHVYLRDGQKYRKITDETGVFHRYQFNRSSNIRDYTVQTIHQVASTYNLIAGDDITKIGRPD